LDLKQRHTEEQIIGILREADKSVAVKICAVSDARRLKKLLAESMLENEVTRFAACNRSALGDNHGVGERGRLTPVVLGLSPEAAT
jgi:hypothetical protein